MKCKHQVLIVKKITSNVSITAWLPTNENIKFNGGMLNIEYGEIEVIFLVIKP